MLLDTQGAVITKPSLLHFWERWKKISTPPHPSALLGVLGQRSHKCVNIYELASLGYTASVAACLHGYTSTWLTDSHLSIRTSQWVRKGFYANPSMTCGTHFGKRFDDNPWEPTPCSLHAPPGWISWAKACFMLIFLTNTKQAAWAGSRSPPNTLQY